jgi:hypothetical protein
MGLLKKQWMEEAKLNHQASSSGMNIEGLCEPRRCEIFYKKSAETGSPVIPFQTYLWEHRTWGRPKCREVF